MFDVIKSSDPESTAQIVLRVELQQLIDVKLNLGFVDHIGVHQQDNIVYEGHVVVKWLWTQLHVQ
jgi:hypothetical protein